MAFDWVVLFPGIRRCGRAGPWSGQPGIVELDGNVSLDVSKWQCWCHRPDRDRCALGQNSAGRDWGKRSKLRTSETVGSLVGCLSVFLPEIYSAHRRRYRLLPWSVST